VRICLAEKNLDGLTMAGFEGRRSFKTGTSEAQPQLVVPTLVHEEMAISNLQ